MCTKYTPFYMSKLKKTEKISWWEAKPLPDPSQPSVTWYWKRIVQCQLHKDEHLTGLSITILEPWFTKLGTLHFIPVQSYHEHFLPHFCAIVQQKSSSICVNFASLFTPNDSPDACLAKNMLGLPPPQTPSRRREGAPSPNPSHGAAPITKPGSATAPPHARPFGPRCPPRQKNSGSAHAVTWSLSAWWLNPN